MPRGGKPGRGRFALSCSPAQRIHPVDDITPMNHPTNPLRPARIRRGLPMLCVPLLLAATLTAPAEPASKAPATKEVRKIGWIEPVEQHIEGWTVHVDPQLLSGEHAEGGALALKMLANHLQRIAILVPEGPLEDLRKVEIWLEYAHPELGAMQYHPGKKWLTVHGYDPRLAKKVHITHAASLYSRSQLLKHPAVILHELAHAYHDQVLGFDDPGVLKAYQQAMKAGTYEQVMLYNGRTVRHYAATNHKEYFSEATEAYFYRNDFYPFVQAELKEHDPTGFKEMQRIWGEAR